MNEPVLRYALTSTNAHAFDDLTLVRLLRPVETDDGLPVEEGTKGVVVAEWGDGAAYEVEFEMGLATVEVNNLIAIDVR